MFKLNCIIQIDTSLTRNSESLMSFFETFFNLFAEEEI